MFRNREIQKLFLLLIVTGITAVILCAKYSRSAGVICGVACIVMGVVYMMFTFKRYKKISELSDYIRQMVDGRPFFDIRDNTEGELSILKNDIYKLTERSSEQANILNSEKAMLADTLSDISHQLKTPLTSLSVMVELLEDDELPLHKRREFMNNLRTGLSRMEWLVLALLKLAKLDSGMMEMKPEKVLLSDLVYCGLNNLYLLIEKKNLCLSIDGDKRLYIICDKNWTVEAFTNILKNAVEHTPECGKVNITLGENPICIWVSVQNSGEGIDTADIPHLFKRFYKGKNSAKDSIGIGLAISLAVMQRQNGDIEVKSGKSDGTIFTVKLYKSTTNYLTNPK